MSDVDDPWDGDPFGPDYEGRTEPNCYDCGDTGAVGGTRYCPNCHPSPRQRRRYPFQLRRVLERMQRDVVAGRVSTGEAPF